MVNHFGGSCTASLVAPRFVTLWAHPVSTAHTHVVDLSVKTFWSLYSDLVFSTCPLYEKEFQTNFLFSMKGCPGARVESLRPAHIGLVCLYS